MNILNNVFLYAPVCRLAGSRSQGAQNDNAYSVIYDEWL
ncbi:hypothetical protein SAMN06265376_11216 [Dokdonia pacifica]|uniref:Uncharacterized protein n=1 Tax=Dokdonia pacifica TaxID=1627892 RepID=A0A239DQ48_9FLAO|nr:hypothetical protein SAMN06265376_11216 [Dokdonia pacifica]